MKEAKLGSLNRKLSNRAIIFITEDNEKTVEELSEMWNISTDRVIEIRNNRDMMVECVFDNKVETLPNGTIVLFKTSRIQGKGKVCGVSYSATPAKEIGYLVEVDRKETIGVDFSIYQYPTILVLESWITEIL